VGLDDSLNKGTSWTFWWKKKKNQFRLISDPLDAVVSLSGWHTGRRGNLLPFLMNQPSENCPVISLKRPVQLKQINLKKKLKNFRVSGLTD